MRARRRMCAVTLGLALATAAGVAVAQPRYGIVRPTSEPASPSVQLGAELYAGNCATCHGIAGGGVTTPRVGAGAILGQGPALRNVGALAPDFYLRLGMMPLANPHEEPEMGRVLFSDAEVRSIVRYVSSLGSGPGIPHPDPSAGSISQGLSLFTEHCAGCHQIEGRGGYVTGARVPPLQGLAPTQIAEAVRLGPYLMPRFSRRQISDAQLNSLIKYVISTHAPDNRGGWGIGNLGPIPEGIVVWWLAVPVLLAMCVILGKRFRP
jgi:ubiquinol-cytochrome c reductase cytochrome c subunit